MGQVFGRDVAVLRDGFATPFTIDDRRTFRGCLYDADGARLALSQRHFGPGFRFRPGDPDTIDPAAVAAAPRLDGRDALSRPLHAALRPLPDRDALDLWILETHPAAAFDRIAFHPYFFGRLAGHARHCLAAFGIAPEAVVLLDAEGTGGPVRFEEVVVPERLFRLWDSADPLLARVFDRIRDAILAGRRPGAGARRLPLPAPELLARRPAGGRQRGPGRGDVPPPRLPGRQSGDGRLPRPGRALRRGPDARRPLGLGAAQLPVPATRGAAARARASGHLRRRPAGQHPGPVQAVAGVDGSFVPFTGRRRHGGTVLHLDLAGVAAVAAGGHRAAVAARPPGSAAALEVAALDLLPPTRAAAAGSAGWRTDRWRDRAASAAERSRGPRPPGGAPDGGAAAALVGT